MKKTEQEHIKELGERWPAALAAASLSVRTNPKLVGLDKIRRPLAEAAALRATGADVPCFTVPFSAGGHPAQIQGIVDVAFADAIKAVEKINIGGIGNGT